MGGKKGLLSIGEVSRITGASVRSLRYYEKINILKPAHTDPLFRLPVLFLRAD